MDSEECTLVQVRECQRKGVRMNISCFVEGQPQPAGSKQAFPDRSGRRKHVVVDACKGSRWWKHVVAATVILHHGRPLLDGPLELRLVFGMRRPKSHFRSNGELRDNAPRSPICRPDVLKLSRAVEDALTGVLWHDDSQIVIEHLEKMYDDPPGVVIEVKQV